MQENRQNPNLHKANKQDQHATEKTFLEHIHELRSRLFWVIFTIIAVSAASFQFKDQLIAVTMAPLHGQKLVYLTPGGGFSFIFTLCVYFGVLVAIPVIIYQVYRFIQPLLRQSSRRLLILFMSLSCLLAAAGAAFGYFVTVPAALDFLATFAGDAVTPNLTAESYLNFVVAYVLGLALLFQLPLLLFIFDHVRPFPPGSLLSSQRFVIIGATIVAAVITPTPDAFNMAIVAIPIIAIYQLGVVAVFARHAALKRKEKSVRRVAQQVVSEKELVDHEFFASIITELNTEPVTVPENEAKPAPTVHKIAVAEHISQPIVKTTDGIVKVPRNRIEAVAVPQREQEAPARPAVARSIDGMVYARPTAHA